MDYSDDTITLDYDLMKGIYSSNNLVLKSTKRGGPQKIERDGFVYYDRRRIRKSANYIKSMDSISSIPDTLKSLIPPDSDPLPPIIPEKPSDNVEEVLKLPAEPEQKVLPQSKKIIKKSGKPGRKKRQSAGSMVMKKPKKIIKKAKLDIESTKDSSEGSINGEGENESNQKKEENEQKHEENRESKKNKSGDKLRYDETAEKVKKRPDRPPFELEDRSQPCYLLNRVPKFSSIRHKSLKIYEINKLYCFDPLNLGL